MSEWLSVLKHNPIEWLLESNNPSVRFFTLKYLLDYADDDPEVLKARNAIMDDRRACSSCQELVQSFGHFIGGYDVLPQIEWCGCSMQIAKPSMQFSRRQLDGDRKRLWRGRETSRRFSRICRAGLNESGTEHQSRTLMSRIVQVSGNGFQDTQQTGSRRTLGV